MVSYMRQGKSGFALLDLVVVMGIIAILGTAGMASLSKIYVVKYENETKQVLKKIRAGYENYYESTGEQPGTLVDIAEHIQRNSPIKDGWGQAISMFHNATVNIDGQSVEYDAAIISGGADGKIDTVYSDPFECVEDDICVYVTVQSSVEAKVDKALSQMKQFRDAWIHIYNQEGVKADSFSDFAAYSVNHSNYADDGVTPLDPWGSEYNAAFGDASKGGHFEIQSLGPDKTRATEDDLSVHVTDTRFQESSRQKTLARIAQANAAKDTYENSFDSFSCSEIPNTCVQDLLYDPNGNYLMNGINTYDAWGNVLSYDHDYATFIGAGPDECFTESQGLNCPDDNVVP